MKIGIIVEGDADKKVLETIFKKEEWKEKVSKEKIRVRQIGGILQTKKKKKGR